MARKKEIKIPDIGSFDSVSVIEVLVAPGDQVKPEDALITLESDKASMDIPSPEAGIVREIRVKLGDKVTAGTVIIILESTESENLATPTEHKPILPQQTSGNPSTLKEIRVPDIGGYDSVNVIGVLVSPGDSVQTEDPLISLESDKATLDIPSPEKGTIQKISIKPGDKVSQGDLILTLLVTTDNQPATAATHTPITKPATPQPATNTQRPAPVQNRNTTTTLPHPINESGFKKAHASPSIRKFARELGVDLSYVQGSGRKGRIQKEDIQAYVKQILTTGQPASPGLYVAELPQIDFKKFGEIEIQPLTKINKLTGKFLHRSWFYIPHVTQFDEADITELDLLRKELQEKPEHDGIKITFLAFLLKAAVSALKEYPRFNASLDNEQENIILKKYFHIGIAVDTPEGLVVPVVRDVDQKNITELAAEIADIAERAREKKIKPADLQGACFTISSLGGVGGTAFTPIINQPEVAILGVSKATIKPVYINNTFVPRKTMPLSLSYDHRVVDGVAAARFTTHLAKTLSDPRQWLL